MRTLTLILLSTLALCALIHSAHDVLSAPGLRPPVETCPSRGCPSSITPESFGAPADTRQALIAVTSTVGAHTIVLDSSLFSSADIGKNIVVARVGVPGARTARVVSGGAGYAIGDTITLAGGTFSQGTVLQVATVSAGAVTGVFVRTPGAYSILPQQPSRQGSTSGAGSGAAFQMTWMGAPLQATIAKYAVKGTFASLTLDRDVGTALSGTIVQVSWGHDDAPAINAAMASTITSLAFDKPYYGQFSTIKLPSDRRVMILCGGATLVALAGMRTQLQQLGPGKSDFYATEGSAVSACRLDGSGLVGYNIEHFGSQWFYADMLLKNATEKNFVIGDTKQGQNNFITGCAISNDPTVVQAHPRANMDIEYTDNQAVDIIADSANTNFISGPNAAGTFWSNLHGYYQDQSSYIIRGGNNYLVNVYADGITGSAAGFRVEGSFTRLLGWSVSLANADDAMRTGVLIASGSHDNVISAGTVYGLTAARRIVSTQAPVTGPNTIVANGTAPSSFPSATDWKSDTTFAVNAIDGVNPAKGVRLGYDDSLNAGVIVSTASGVAFEPLLLNPSGGNVGIGTLSPSSRFTVVGDVDATRYKTGKVPGVSCAGMPTRAFAVTNGIVTHC